MEGKDTMQVVIKVLKSIWKFVLKYNEWFFSFPIGYLVFYYGTTRMLRSRLDVYDVGISQKLLIGTAFIFFAIGMTRVILRLMWPYLSKQIDEDTNEKWEKLPFVHVIWLSVVLFSVVLLSLSNLIASI